MSNKIGNAIKTENTDKSRSKTSIIARESIYKRYQPSFKSPEMQNDPVYWFIFSSDKLLVEIINNQTNIPLFKDLKDLNISPIRKQYLGTFDGQPCYSAEVDGETSAPQGMEFRNLRSLYNCLDEDVYLLAGRAVQVVNWDSTHQFCGKCGAKTEYAEEEMAKICPECGFTSFTRLSPAVITAIIKEGQLLMARHTRTSGNYYGLIAGFVEAGETLEEAVQRETLEEVGIKVKNIEYFHSQPWPYPHSLMVGFTCEYESGQIKVDEKEIIDAKWFKPDDLPVSLSKISIAGELIQWYKLHYG